MRTTRALVVLALIMAVTPAALHAAEGAGTTPLFTVNLGTTVWTTLVFFALLGILWKFAWGPILAAVDAREKAIQSALDEAARQNQDAARILEEHRRQLAEARRQASDLLAEGKVAGEKVKKEIEEKARTEAQAMVERAKHEIGRERDAALDLLRRESVDLALAAAARLVQEKMDPTKDRQYVERFLDQVSGGRGASA
ncbi:MAG: F0F1 ATP synthase subunit B [Gemmatimonadetes bacterium]|nr:F0F1 ATP synthase subunit B [Gemmatimonadota bacterium]